jgi:hypothetical protein
MADKSVRQHASDFDPEVRWSFSMCRRHRPSRSSRVESSPVGFDRRQASGTQSALPRPSSRATDALARYVSTTGQGHTARR